MEVSIMYKNIVLLFTIATLAYGADEPPNKRKREAPASMPKKRRRIDQANTSGIEKLSEQQKNIVRRLKAHSILFKQCVEDIEGSDDIEVYNAIMIHQSIYPREGAVEDDRECELTEEGVIDLLRGCLVKYI